jgi:hypothetical protein
MRISYKFMVRNKIEELSKVDSRVRLGWCVWFVLGMPLFHYELLEFFEGNYLMTIVIKLSNFCLGIFVLWSVKMFWPLGFNKKLMNKLKQDEFRQGIVTKTFKVVALVMYVMIAVGFFIANYVEVSLKFAFGLMLYVTTVVTSVTYLILNRD